MAGLTDTELLAMFNDRDQAALSETQKQYGGFCFRIAVNILGCREDAEECLNDALMKLWNSIPPIRPAGRSTGRLSRSTAACLTRSGWSIAPEEG